MAFDSEDPMFILYTSGSTESPRGLCTLLGGYLVNAAMTTYNSFDIKSPSANPDIFCCAADCGWITGHTYIVYGPLAWAPLHACSNLCLRTRTL